MRTAERVFVVTGGGNGIGQQVVLTLLRRGSRVAAVDLNGEGLKETARLAGAGDRVSLHTANVTDVDQVQELPEAVMAAHGAVDGVLNVAGIVQRFVPFSQLTMADIERVMNVNFYGVVATCQAFLPHLMNRPEAALVNVSSMGGFLPVPGQTIYGASKAAVKLLTEGLRSELTNTPVTVTVVFPGAVGTNITRNSGVSVPGAAQAEAQPERKTTSPHDAAETIVRGMEKGAYRVFIGNDARGLDALTRLAPERAMGMIAKQMSDLLSH